MGKKLKGHVKLELIDAETKKSRVIAESDNMLTNALSKMFNFAATHALGTSSFGPYSTHWENLLGGLVLFDTALTEDADNIHLPAGTKPVGYGIVGDNTNYNDYLEWGQYDTQESDTSQANTKTFVWQFLPSHANNRIASICLTHKNNGLFGWGTSDYHNTGRQNYANITLGTALVASSKGKQALNKYNYGVIGNGLALSDGSYVDFCIDSENDEKYMLKVCKDGISIIKHKLYPENLDIFQDCTAVQPYTEETYAGTFNATYFFHFYNPDEKALYFWIADSANVGNYSNQSLSVVINKFDMETKTLTAGWKTVTLSGYNVYGGLVINSSAVYFWTSDTNNVRYIKKHTFSSGSVTEIKNFNGVYNYSFVCGKPYIINGIIYYEAVMRSDSYGNIVYDIIVDTSDDEVRYTNTIGIFNSNTAYSAYGQHVPPIDKTQIVFGSRLDYNQVLYFNSMNLQQSESSNTQAGNVTATVHYLGTIYNLAEPVVKTAADYLKVTYTITAATEE